MDVARIDLERQPVLVQRVATLWHNDTLHSSNSEVEIAINLALLGLLQNPAA
jgi:hypothetical protein